MSIAPSFFLGLYRFNFHFFAEDDFYPVKLKNHFTGGVCQFLPFHVPGLSKAGRWRAETKKERKNPDNLVYFLKK